MDDNDWSVANSGGGSFSSDATATPSSWPTSNKVKTFSNGEWSRNLNKMISVHQLPFFGQSQAFMGNTLWDWIKKPRARFSDSIDRLNCNVVPSLLLFFVSMISANIFGFGNMSPMRCLKSLEFPPEGDELEYALDYCMSKNQYYVAPEEEIPWSNQNRRSRQLGYYHWVPIMLCLQAIFFYIPNWLWNQLNQQSGIDYTKFIEEATKLKSMCFATIKERQEQISQLRDKLSEAMLNRDPYRRIVGCRFGQSMGAYVSFLYICIKALYLINVATQFGLLNTFIGRDYRLWGFEVLKALINGENWQDSPIFPRLTLCDVPIRRLGDTARYTLQCHLRINTYNEKIYLFIWWGFGAVALLTLVNFFYYFIVLFLWPCTQENSVRHLLKQDKHRDIVYSESPDHRRLIRRFANHALCKDGVLLFWFIEEHAGSTVARELMSELFLMFKSDVHKEEPPTEVSVADKKGKGSFSSQINCLDNTGSGGGGNVQYENDIELIDGDSNRTEQTALYSSTPKQANRSHPYSADQRRRNDSGVKGSGGGGTGGLMSSVFRRFSAVLIGTLSKHSTRPPIEQV